MRLLISTGEVSGDLQGSLLIKALLSEAAKRSLDLEIIALGGPRMEAAGADLIADTTSIGAIGLFEALPLLLPTLKIQKKLDAFVSQSSIDGIVLIDYMGPNIRIGNKLKKSQPKIPIIYYIAPQEWAWRLGDGGTTDLIGFTDKILAIFQLEADFYKKLGGNVEWVGHPMVDTLKPLPERIEALETLGLSKDKRVLLILPASRPQEIHYLMPNLTKAASLIQKYDSSFYVIVPSGLPEFEEGLKESLVNQGVDGKIISSEEIDYLKPYLFSAAELALCKSGTVNMELALHNVPQIVGYKVSSITAFIARNILGFNVEHISPVNLLLNQRVVPELVQEEFTPENIFKYAIPLLNNGNERLAMLDQYKKLKQSLGQKGAPSRAAKEDLDVIVR